MNEINMMQSLSTQPWYAIVGEIVLLANMITAILPTRFKDNPFMDFMMSTMNFLAVNVFKNKNKSG